MKKAKKRNNRTYEIVSSAQWYDIQAEEKVYLKFDGNTQALDDILNNNSQFSGTNSIERVEGEDFPLHEQLSEWVNNQYHTA